MTPEELDAIEARERATPPGPWVVRYSEHWHRPDSPICRNECKGGQPEMVKVEVETPEVLESRKHYPNPTGLLHGRVDRDGVEEVSGPDGVVFGIGQDYDDYGHVEPRSAEFAAHAKRDIPRLIAELRKAWGELRQLERR
jgi:hypothetical protein